MNKALLLLLLVATGSAASEKSFEQEFCDIKAYTAKKAMSLHQSGLSQNEVYKKLNKDWVLMGEVIDREVVDRAFRRPQYGLQSSRFDAIKEYTESVMEDCKRSVGMDSGFRF